MTISALQRKLHLASVSAAARGKRVIVSFDKVPVLTKEEHRRLQEVARDPKVACRRVFPML